MNEYYYLSITEKEMAIDQEYVAKFHQTSNMQATRVLQHLNSARLRIRLGRHRGASSYFQNIIILSKFIYFFTYLLTKLVAVYALHTSSDMGKQAANNLGTF